MYGKNTRQSRAFSLIELVIVLVILAALSAIAIPRLTRGASNSGSTALKSDLQTMRSAIELYRAEHEGKFPTAANFSDQLTKFSDVAGTSFKTSADVAAGVTFGPYLKAIPALPVGAEKGSSDVAAAAADGVGWIYNETTGEITPNTADTETDLDGVKYNTY